MTEYLHKRDDEDTAVKHRRDENMPEIMKWVANFIQRVGYPIFVSCVLMYIVFESLDKNTKAIVDLQKAIMNLTSRIQPYKATGE